MLGTDPFSPPLGPGGKGEGLGDVVPRQELPQISQNEQQGLGVRG